MAESELQGMETVQVPMVGPEIVKQLRALHALGWAASASPRSSAFRETARDGACAKVLSPRLRCARRRARSTTHSEPLAQQLLDGPAQGNGVVVQRLLAGASSPGPPRRGRAKEASDAPSATQRRTRHRRPRARSSRRAG
jgi:hypothetical protein